MELQPPDRALLRLFDLMVRELLSGFDALTVRRPLGRKVALRRRRWRQAVLVVVMMLLLLLGRRRRLVTKDAKGKVRHGDASKDEDDREDLFAFVRLAYDYHDLTTIM